MTNLKIVQDFYEGSSQHRLRNTETGETTHWAPYQCFTYLDGAVGCTAYWSNKEGIFTPEEFMKLCAVGKANTCYTGHPDQLPPIKD